MDVGLEIVGLDKLRKKILKNLDLDEIKKAVKSNGADLQQKAMSSAPVDTGTLKRSITIEITNGGMEAHIQPTVGYAPYLEWGTRYMTAQPFMRPSFQSQVERFKSDLRRLVK